MIGLGRIYPFSSANCLGWEICIELARNITSFNSSHFTKTAACTVLSHKLLQILQIVYNLKQPIPVPPHAELFLEQPVCLCLLPLPDKLGILHLTLHILEEQRRHLALLERLGKITPVCRVAVVLAILTRGSVCDARIGEVLRIAGCQYAYLLFSSGSHGQGMAQHTVSVVKPCRHFPARSFNRLNCLPTSPANCDIHLCLQTLSPSQ